MKNVQEKKVIVFVSRIGNKYAPNLYPGGSVIRFKIKISLSLYIINIKTETVRAKTNEIEA